MNSPESVVKVADLRRVAVVRALIRAGANRDLTDEGGMNALQHAEARGRQAVAGELMLVLPE
jgi:ankyrin repeat protein